MLRFVLLLALALTTVAPAMAQSGGSDGFIYGTLTLQNGDTHTGFLRWEDEEAYWDDLFHSRQINIPWVQYADLKALHREKEKRYFETHGLIDRIAYALENKNPDEKIRRLFVARFGNIEVITIDEDENITVTMNNGSSLGSKFEVRGYSNDVSTDILVYSDAGEEDSFDWDDLAEIRFAQAPAEATPYAERLYGRVSSSKGEFEGFIQWDQSECTSIDMLDSRQEDLAMGEILAITRKPGGEVIADLVDGRQLSLSGSNDVDDGNRGVVVETEHLGRINVPWKRFQKIEFMTGKGSGPKRDSYADTGALTGNVKTTDGQQYSGRLVYDLGAASQHDIFNGTQQDINYNIPFGLIETITPLEEDACRVTLRNGQILELSDNPDTGAKSTGVLIFNANETKAERVPWAKIQEIRFQP